MAMAIITEATLVDQAKGKEFGYSVRPGKIKKQAAFACKQRNKNYSKKRTE